MDTVQIVTWVTLVMSSQPGYTAILHVVLFVSVERAYSSLADMLSGSPDNEEASVNY